MLKKALLKHPLKEHRCKSKTDKITYSKSLSRIIMALAEVNLHCILKWFKQLG